MTYVLDLGEFLTKVTWHAGLLPGQNCQAISELPNFN